MTVLSERWVNPVSGHLPQIDSLRAIAVLAVLIFHLDGRFLPGGFTGVDVFFVISGYVVSASLFDNRAESWRSFVALFYARRMLRILPALLVCLLATTFAAVLFVPDSWLSGANKLTVLLAFFGLSNFALMRTGDAYFSPRVDYNVATHTWSLGVEEQFYFVFPLLFYWWARHVRSGAGQKPLRLRDPLLGLLLASALLAVWASLHSPVQSYYSLWTRFWELAAGALLFRWHASQRAEPGERGPLPLRLIAGLLLIAAGLIWADKRLFPMPWGLLPVCGTLLAIDAIVRRADMGSRQAMAWLAWSPLVWVGKVSYSLYLWHWPVYTLARWTTGLESAEARLIAVVAVLALSAASYYGVENPIRRSSRLRALAPWQTMSLAGLATFGCAAVAAVALIPAKSQLSLSVTRDARAWYAMDWYARKPSLATPQCTVARTDRELAGFDLSTYRAEGCTLPERRRLIVVGDSHAAAYSTNFSRLVSEHPEVQVEVYARAGCGFMRLMNPVASDPPHCASFARQAKAELLKTLKPADVVFLPSLRVRRLSDQFELFDKAKVLERMDGADARKARAEALAEAQAWMAELAKTGATFIIEAPKPVFEAPPFRCSDWFNASNPMCARGMVSTREEQMAYRAPVMQALAQLQSAAPGLQVWDPFATLCPQAQCTTRLDGRPIYFDGDHLSGYGNDKLYPSWSETVLAAARRQP